MTPEDRILDRIKKLLRLSRSSNPHEAALALQRAMDLAQINGLRLASIDPDNEVAGIPWTEPENRTTNLRFRAKRDNLERLVGAPH